MYEIDEKDRVRELTDLPRPDVGAPLPAVFASEDALHLVYLVADAVPNWGDTPARVLSQISSHPNVAIIRFDACTHMFGPPNDEAFQGHPLAARGLRPYAVWEVENSSWIRKLERINSVHPSHSPEHFDDFRHFIFAFHDSTFECVATGFDWRVEFGSVKSALQACVSDWRTDGP